MSHDQGSCDGSGDKYTGPTDTSEMQFECDDSTPCEETFCETKRRKLLGAVAAGGSLALAGCAGAFASPEGSTTPRERVVDEFDVNFLRQGETVSVSGDRNLLQASEAAELEPEIAYFCRTGFCGVCLSQVDGDASELVNMQINQYGPLTDELVEEGYMLPCTSQPRDDFAIETGVQLPEEEEEEDDEEEDDEEDDDEGDEDVGVPRHAIDYVNQQWTIEVPENQNLLEAGEARGFDLPYQCREGFCGQCLAQIDGDANELVEMTTNDYGPLDEDAMEDGYTLTCTGQPRGEFELESDKYGEL